MEVLQAFVLTSASLSYTKIYLSIKNIVYMLLIVLPNRNVLLVLYGFIWVTSFDGGSAI